MISYIKPGFWMVFGLGTDECATVMYNRQYKYWHVAIRASAFDNGPAIHWSSKHPTRESAIKYAEGWLSARA